MSLACDLCPRRRAVAGALAAGAGATVVAGLEACSGRARSRNRMADQTLRVAVFRAGAETFLQPAGQAATPYRLSLAEFGAGNLITEAIIAGAIDIGSMSEIPPIFVAASNPPMRLVALLKGDVNNQVVLVPRGSRVTSLAGLRGKTIGYIRATTSHYLLLKVLAEQGLSFTDVRPVGLSPQDGRAAFERGSLDAWVAYGIQAQAVRASAGARVLATGLGRLSGNYLFAAAGSALRDPGRRAAIEDFLGRIHRVNRWVEANPDEWARRSSLATGVPAAFYARQRRERSAPTSLAPVDAAAIASQQAVADAFAEAGVLPKRPDVSGLWDTALNPALEALVNA